MVELVALEKRQLNQFLARALITFTLFYAGGV